MKQDDESLHSLQRKLAMLAVYGKDAELIASEAVIYGVKQADVFENNEGEEGADEF